MLLRFKRQFRRKDAHFPIPFLSTFYFHFNPLYNPQSNILPVAPQGLIFVRRLGN